MYQLELAGNILDCLNEIVFLSDQDNNLLYINRAVEQLTGWTAQKALGKKCYEVFRDPSGNCLDRCPLKHLEIEKNGVCRFEKTFLNYNGELCLMQVSASPFYQGSKNVGTIMVLQDITRLREYETLSINTQQQLEHELQLRKKLEDSLRRSEAMYRAMFEYTGTAMLVINEDKTIAMANRELEKMTGYRRKDIVGKRKWDEFVHPEDLKLMQRYHVKRRKEGGKVPNNYEFRLFDAKGELRDIYYTIGMIPGTGQSVGSMLDITERKQMERALRDSEEKYRQLLEDIEDVFYEVDMFGNFTFVNDSVTRVFGFTREQLIGNNYRDMTDEENRRKIYEAYNKVYTSGVPEQGFSWAIITPQGEERVLEVSASPIRDLNGNIVGFRGTARDITERIRTEERLRYLSMHDALTGLYNRAYFEEEMQRLEKGRHFPVSIICGDVDELKTINDTMGHKKGDELLTNAAETIRKSIRAEDMAARVGGDEFVVILPETGTATAIDITARIRTSIEQYNNEHPALPLSISLGWATAQTPAEMNDLYKRADDHMYREKTKKKTGSGL